MRTTVTLDSHRLVQLLRQTKAKSKARAVSIAVDAFLANEKIQHLKSLKGTLSFRSYRPSLRHRAR